jgi:hypothetical protein
MYILVPSGFMAIPDPFVTCDATLNDCENAAREMSHEKSGGGGGVAAVTYGLARIASIA